MLLPATRTYPEVIRRSFARFPFLSLVTPVFPHRRCLSRLPYTKQKEGKGQLEDKLTLACFNSGDVPELIGRLSVALSHATHKVISLPMFRKDHGVSYSCTPLLGSAFTTLNLRRCFEIPFCAETTGRGVSEREAGEKSGAGGVAAYVDPHNLLGRQFRAVSKRRRGAGILPAILTNFWYWALGPSLQN